MSIIEKALKNKLIKESVYKEDDSEQTFIDTGCLSLNLLFSGRLNGGIPVGKISQIAAPSSLGKTFIGMKVARNAQRKGMEVIYLDTEFAYDANFADNLGIDQSKILVIQDNRIERVQSKLLTITDGLSKEEKKSLLVVLDSWGGLVTSKTEEDAMDGNDKRDMTISQKKNSFARLLTGIEVSMFIINHVYDCGNGQIQVQTPLGNKFLKDIIIGDEVITPYGNEEVLNTFKYENANIYEIELEDGTKLSFTENHKLLIKDASGESAWKAICEMEPGDEIISGEEAVKFPLKV
jgi:RecA/RadA recombinase